MPERKHINPPSVKVGEEILLISGVNGNSQMNGRTGIARNNSATTGEFSVRFNNGGGEFTIYRTDRFTLTNRALRAERLKELLEKQKEEIADLEEYVSNLTKFESDDDEMAHNLCDLLKAKTPDKMLVVIKELRKKGVLK